MVFLQLVCCCCGCCCCCCCLIVCLFVAILIFPYGIYASGRCVPGSEPAADSNNASCSSFLQAVRKLEGFFS
jgi:hypothetical protein